MASKTSQLLSVRLSNDVLARIDEVGKAHPPPPGIKLTRSNTARRLLLKGLEAFESQSPAPQQPAPPSGGEPSGGEREEGSRFESWAY